MSPPRLWYAYAMLSSALVAVLGSASCASSNTLTVPDSVAHPADTHAYLGGMTGRYRHNGLVTLVIGDTGLVSLVTGSYKPIGSPAVDLAGTLDRGSGALHFAGGGYDVTATDVDGSLNGGYWTFTGTSGADDGPFAAVPGNGTPIGLCGMSYTTYLGMTIDTENVALLFNGDSGAMLSAYHTYASWWVANRNGDTVTIVNSGNHRFAGLLIGGSITASMDDSLYSGTLTATRNACQA